MVVVPASCKVRGASREDGVTEFVCRRVEGSIARDSIDKAIKTYGNAAASPDSSAIGSAENRVTGLPGVSGSIATDSRGGMSATL